MTPASKRLVLACVVLGLAGPGAALIGLFGLRFGLWDWRVGHEILTLDVGLWLGLGGAAATLLATALSRAARDRARTLLSAAVLLVVALSLFLILGERRRIAAHPPVAEASSDWTDRPGFSAAVMAARGRDAAAPLRTGGDPAWCSAVTVPRQAVPEEARAALEAADVQVIGVSPFRAEGSVSSFWYGFEQDVVIRIRPAATDVRVAGREDRADGGAACRLADRVVAALEG